MAFLTGVDLEQRFGEQALAIPKKRPPRRRRQQLELEDAGWQAKALALCDEPKEVQYGQLLKQTEALSDTNDPLEELRRRIKRTRAKMDSQNQVMDGFLSDVRQMNHLHRSFSSTELSPPATPALTAGPQRPALGAPRPSSASKSAAARAISLRSDAGSGRQLAVSRSQPALMAAAAVGLAHQAAPLALPPRRAPPGAPCSELQKTISAAAAARRSAVACSTAGAGGKNPLSGMSRLSQHSRSSPSAF